MRSVSILAVLLVSLSCSSAEETPQRARKSNPVTNSDVSACEAGNGLAILGGSKISDTEHPYAQKIVAASNPQKFCSGVFVNHNVYLTANHCINGYLVPSNPQPNSFTVLNAKPIAIVNHPNSSGSSGGPENNDISLLIFPDGTSPHFIPLIERAPVKGETFAVVGFGPDSGNDPAKREGTNTISAITGAGMIEMRRSGGKGAIGTLGDSGGPLMIEGKLAGTAVASDRMSWTLYTNLFASENLNFLRNTAKSKNIDICGLDGFACNQPSKENPAPGTPTVPSKENCQQTSN